jgi:hypothetical protein
MARADGRFEEPFSRPRSEPVRIWQDASLAGRDETIAYRSGAPRRSGPSCWRRRNLSRRSFVRWAVAMKVAARQSGRVAKLVLLEPIPFHLLAQAGCTDAFAEARNLCNIVKKYGAVGEWSMAAEKFADYWTGAGTWQEMPPDRRLAFSEALKPNLFEWDAVMDDTTPVEEWAALLPRATLLAFDPAGVSPTREIAAILSRLDLRGGTGRRSHGPDHAPRPDQSPRLLLPRADCTKQRACGCRRMAPSAIGERVQ